MHNKFLLHKILILFIFIVGCNPAAPVITDEPAYVKSIEEWQYSRLERLKSETGWLNLAGLFWLKEGENSFGSDPANDIVFPDKAEPFCGTVTLNEGKVFLLAAEGVNITSNDATVTSLALNDDHSDSTSYLEQGDLAWYIVKRGDKYGIRLRDYQHPRINKLDHIPTYPIQIDYVVEATLKPFVKPRAITVATAVEGFTEEYQCPGELRFRIKKKDLTLYPFISGDGYFLIIADETTGLETYGGGRYIYSVPDSAGRIILDFNKAYNPPCAFSPYATCPRPPRENLLPLAIKAGEKSVHLE